MSEAPERSANSSQPWAWALRRASGPAPTGAQDLSYGADGWRGTLWYAAFDVSARADGTVRRLDAAELLEGELPVVPRLYAGPYDIERVLEFASGRETVSGRGLRLREGVVMRPAVERYSAVTGAGPSPRRSVRRTRRVRAGPSTSNWLPGVVAGRRGVAHRR